MFSVIFDHTFAALSRVWILEDCSSRDMTGYTMSNRCIGENGSALRTVKRTSNLEQR